MNRPQNAIIKCKNNSDRKQRYIGNIYCVDKYEMYI